MDTGDDVPVLRRLESWIDEIVDAECETLPPRGGEPLDPTTLGGTLRPKAPPKLEPEDKGPEAA